ncbi:DM13 domain-containing protein [Synechococcus sp. CS-1329]|nr:DM13 domain-containing protein [Synechococcus sp. CS-1329]
MKLIRHALIVGLAVATAGLSGCAGNSNNQEKTSTPEKSSTVETAEAPGKSGAILIRSGPFVSGEHPTTGGAQLVKQNNQNRLELNQVFATSTSGPDLVVVLHRSADVISTTTPPAYPINEGDYVLLAPLESYEGAQSYPIPANINLDEFQSVAIWCRRFNATFGSATLK